MLSTLLMNTRSRPISVDVRLKCETKSWHWYCLRNFDSVCQKKITDCVTSIRPIAIIHCCFSLVLMLMLILMMVIILYWCRANATFQWSARRCSTEATWLFHIWPKTTRAVMSVSRRTLSPTSSRRRCLSLNVGYASLVSCLSRTSHSHTLKGLSTLVSETG